MVTVQNLVVAVAVEALAVVVVETSNLLLGLSCSVCSRSIVRFCSHDALSTLGDKAGPVIEANNRILFPLLADVSCWTLQHADQIILLPCFVHGHLCIMLRQ